MSKITTGLIVILVSLSFMFFSKTVSQAQDPVPVTNPGPVSPTTSPTTSTNCVPDPPDGLCSNSRPCCNYPGRTRICDGGYCRDASPPSPVRNPGPSAVGSIPEIGDLKVGEIKSITISGLDPDKRYFWKISKVTSSFPTKGYTGFFEDCFDANSSGEIQKSIGPFSIGLYRLEISRATSTGCGSSGSPTSKEFSVGGPTGQGCCTVLFPVYDSGQDKCKKGPLPFEQAVPTECSKSDTFCEPESLQCFTTKTFVKGGKICKNPDDDDFDKDKHAVCSASGGKQCGSDQDPAMQTAIGCIHTSPAGFIKDFLKFATAISGGLAFLMMLLGAFQMLTSAGNPDTLQAGRERFQSAIIGLLFVIFAVLLLQILGADILKLPGFGR